MWETNLYTVSRDLYPAPTSISDRLMFAGHCRASDVFSWHKIHFSQSNVIADFDDEDAKSGRIILTCLDISFHKLNFISSITCHALSTIIRMVK